MVWFGMVLFCFVWFGVVRVVLVVGVGGMVGVDRVVEDVVVIKPVFPIFMAMLK